MPEPAGETSVAKPRVLRLLIHRVVVLVVTRSHSRENDTQSFSNTLVPLRYPSLTREGYEAKLFFRFCCFSLVKFFHDVFAEAKMM